MVISYGGGNNYMEQILVYLPQNSLKNLVQHYGTQVSILNHSYEASFVWDGPTIINYKPI